MVKLLNFNKIFSDFLFLPAFCLRDAEVDEGATEERQTGEDEVAGRCAYDGAQGWYELSHQERHQPVEGGAQGGGDSLDQRGMRAG